MSVGSSGPHAIDFERPIRTRNCPWLPDTLTTAPEALAAVRRLPPEMLKTDRWRRVVGILERASDTHQGNRELTSVAATELRAALQAMGWLD